MEAQGRAERKIGQEVARNIWLSGREEKTLNDLNASQNNLTVAEVDTELEEDVGEDRDTVMRIEDTEAEIDAWLNELAEEIEENTTILKKWVIKELASCNRGAVTNLEVGLVDKHSYESGTWLVNRWI